MQPLIAVLAALVTLLTASPSVAQTKWTSPSGGFTLDIPKEWQVITLQDGRMEPDTNIDIVIGAGIEAGAPMKAGCTVMHMVRSTTGEVTQAEVNSALATWNQDLVVSHLSKGSTRITNVLEFSNRTVAGVRTVSMNYVAGTGASKTQFWHAQFFVPLKKKDAAFFTIACLASVAEMEPEFLRAASTFKSLAFQGR